MPVTSLSLSSTGHACQSSSVSCVPCASIDPSHETSALPGNPIGKELRVGGVLLLQLMEGKEVVSGVFS